MLTYTYAHWVLCSLQHPFLLGPLTKREAQELLDTVSNGQPAQYVDPADIEEEVTSLTCFIATAAATLLLLQCVLDGCVRRYNVYKIFMIDVILFAQNMLRDVPRRIPSKASARDRDRTKSEIRSEWDTSVFPTAWLQRFSLFRSIFDISVYFITLYM